MIVFHRFLLILVAFAGAGLAFGQAVTNAVAQPANVVGGRSAWVYVYLNGPASVAGTTVNLTSDNPSAASVPATVTIPSGLAGERFPIATYPVDSSTVANITAIAGSLPALFGKTTQITIQPASLASVVSVPPSVIGGNSGWVYVYMNGKAGPSGTSVSLLSDTPAAATVPATVTIPAGLAGDRFPVATFNVDSAEVVVISASTGSGPEVKVSLTVSPAALFSVTANPSVVGGNIEPGAVHLNGQAGPNCSVELSGTGSLSPPSSVAVPQGKLGAAFTIQAKPVDVDESDTLTTALNGVQKTASITVKAARLSKLTSPGALALSGNNLVLVIQMDGKTGPSGRDVALTSDSPAVSVPATVHLDPGTQVLKLTLPTTPVDSKATVNLGATTAAPVGSSAGLQVTVDKAQLFDFKLAHEDWSPLNGSFVGGNWGRIFVILKGQAGPTGCTVVIGGNAFSLVYNVAIGVGATYGTSYFHTYGYNADTDVYATATFNGVTKTVNFTMLAARPSKIEFFEGATEDGIWITLDGDSGAAFDIDLTCSRPDLLPLPAVATVPIMQHGWYGSVPRPMVTSPTPFTITATARGKTITYDGTLNP